MLRNGLVLCGTIALGAVLTYWLDYSQNVPPMAASVQKSQILPDNVPDPASYRSAKADSAGSAGIVPDFSFMPLVNAGRIAGDNQQTSPKILDIKDFRGKIVVLNFWASWCVPCVREFPHFLKLAAEYPDKIVFLGLSSDHDRAAMERFLNRLWRDHPAEMALDNVILALDDKASVTRGLFQTFRLPETILIDADGVMRKKIVGADWDYADLNDLIAKIDSL